MWELLTTQSPLEWAVTLLALIYVILAARNNPWCWVFGAIACTGWAYLDVSLYNLYSDAILQVFYVIMSGIGLHQWLKGGINQKALEISRMTTREHILVIGLSSGIGLILGYFVGEYLPAAATYPDALTTSFSIVTTYLLLQRKLENWLYWIVIDLAYVAIYWSRGATLFVFIMIIYVVVAGWGYYNWRKELRGKGIKD